MSAVLHLIRHDVRRWGLLIAFSLVLTIAERWLEERAPVIAFNDLSRGGWLEVVQVLMAVTTALLLGVIVAVVVQETPVLGRRAFLLTRPITPRQILTAKLVMLGVVFVAIPAAIDFAVLAQRGLPLDLVALTALDSLLGVRLLVLLLLVLAASLTETLVGYFVVLASGAGVLLLAAVAFAMVAFTRIDADRDWWMAGPEPFSPDLFESVRAWLTMVATLAVPLALVAWRRRGAAIAVLLVLIALAPVPWWPPLPRFSEPIRIEPPAWASDSRSPRLVLEPVGASIAAPGSGNAMTLSRNKPPRLVQASLSFPSVPAGWVAGVVELRSRFTLREGAVIESHGVRQGALSPGNGETRLSEYDGWRGVLGRDIRKRGVAVPAPDARTVIADLESAADVTRLTAGPARFEADVLFDLWRFDVAAVVPQAPARIVRDQALFEIVAVRASARTLSLLVRRTILSPTLRPGVPPAFFSVLTSPDGRESASGAETAAPGTLMQGLSRIRLPGGMFVGGESPTGSAWQVVFFTREDIEATSQGWLERARVAVVDRRYGGRIRRQLQADNLVVRDQHDGRGSPEP